VLLMENVLKSVGVFTALLKLLRTGKYVPTKCLRSMALAILNSLFCNRVMDEHKLRGVGSFWCQCYNEKTYTLIK
jgi:hypothetical protein